MAAFEPSWATAAYWLQYAPTLHVSDAAMLRRGLVPFVQEVPSSALLHRLVSSGFFEQFHEDALGYRSLKMDQLSACVGPEAFVLWLH